MTLEENVELPLRLAEVPRGERPARVREALERVGLGARESIARPSFPAASSNARPSRARWSTGR